MATPSPGYWRPRGRGTEDNVFIHHRPRSRSNSPDLHGISRPPLPRSTVVSLSANSVADRPPPPAPPQQEPIYYPPIHQEIITHHRHVHYDAETKASSKYRSKQNVWIGSDGDSEGEVPSLANPPAAELHRNKPELFDEQLALFTQENDLKFANALRRLIWNAGLPSDTFDQLMVAHAKKQKRKHEIRQLGLEASRALHTQETISQNLEDEATEMDTDDGASTVRPERRHQRKQPRRPNKTRRHTPARRVTSRVEPTDTYRHKIDVPPQTSSIYVTAPAGYVEFRSADGATQHVEEWMPLQEDNEDRQHAIPRVPSPPSETNQAVERKPQAQLVPITIKEDIMIELLDKLVRQVDTMHSKLGMGSQEQQEDHGQDLKATADSVTYSEHEGDSESQRRQRQQPKKTKQIAGSTRDKKPLPWKKQQQQQQNDKAQKGVPVAA